VQSWKCSLIWRERINNNCFIVDESCWCFTPNVDRNVCDCSNLSMVTDCFDASDIAALSPSEPTMRICLSYSSITCSLSLIRHLISLWLISVWSTSSTFLSFIFSRAYLLCKLSWAWMTNLIIRYDQEIPVMFRLFRKSTCIVLALM